LGGIAVVGAGGFVGARLLEMAALSGRDDVVPIVRGFHSVARSANLGVRHRLGDASRPATLARAFDGCEAVVNLTTGDPAEIVRATSQIYDAAVAAGARVLVHLSSATVYGQVDRADLPDDAPPLRDHWMPYAREKARAEDHLRARMADGRLAVVVLRPGLVWGPGSPWVLGPATDLVRGTAYLVGDGAGICDLMYVDDLVRAIHAAVRAPVPGFYHAADDELPTWRAYYTALADGLGVEIGSVHVVSGDRYRPGLRDRLETVRSVPAYRWLKERMPLETRMSLKARMRRTPSGPAAPAVSRTMWHLQTTRHRRPTLKLRDTYGLGPGTAFSAGMSASLAWLRFIGIDERDAIASVGGSAEGVERTWTAS
jgi:nucleoside-diphosphate-sugar epimerase